MPKLDSKSTLGALKNLAFVVVKSIGAFCRAAQPLIQTEDKRTVKAVGEEDALRYGASNIALAPGWTRREKSLDVLNGHAQGFIDYQ